MPNSKLRLIFYLKISEDIYFLGVEVIEVYKFHNIYMLILLFFMEGCGFSPDCNNLVRVIVSEKIRRHVGIDMSPEICYFCIG